MLKKQRRLAGDTIVEVLFCIAILGAVITSTYALASHSLAESITASERTEASKLASSQIEALKLRYQRSTNQVWTANFTPTNLNFCLDATVTDPASASWLPIKQNDTGNPKQLTISTNNNNYKIGCVVPQDTSSAKYFINISTATTNAANPSPTYLVTVRWNKIGGGEQNVSQIYFRLPGNINTSAGFGFSGCSFNCNGFYVGIWGLRFQNRSDLGATPLTPLQISQIVDCTWDWGNGNVTHEACLPGESTHEEDYSPFGARAYTITLTEILADGTSISPTSNTYWMPHGHSPCDVDQVKNQLLCSLYSSNPATYVPCDPNTDGPSCKPYP